MKREHRKVGGWWGNALNEYRKAKTRQTEEVDVVGLQRDDVPLVSVDDLVSGLLGGGYVTHRT